MSTRRVVQDALILGGLWGLIDVLFSFFVGSARAVDAFEIFLVPAAALLGYHLALLAVFRLAPRPALRALILCGVLIPPTLFLSGTRGRTSLVAFAAGAVPLLILAGMVLRRLRGPDDEGWLAPPRFLGVLACYAAGAAFFAFHTARLALVAPPLLSRMAACVGLVGALAFVAARVPRFHGRITAAVVVLVTVGAVYGRSSSPPRYKPSARTAASAPSGRSALPNVLLIVVDTVRADHLDLYGYSRPTLPLTSRYLKEGLVFDRAIASGTFSLTSHGSIFSGLMPSSHGAYPTFSKVRQHSRLWPEIRTLAEDLRDRGYRTEGVSANDVFLGVWTGFHKGFDTFQTYAARNLRYASFSTRLWRRLREAGFDIVPFGGSTWSAREISDAAIDILAHTEDPFFLFLNYFDAHGAHRLTGSPPWKGDNGPEGIKAYDSEIADIDREVARLLGSLQENGRLQNTLVIFTADHGEYLGERGLKGHPPEPYEESIHIPLALRLKGVVPEGRSERRTGLFEIFRIVVDVLEKNPLDWLSVEEPEPRILTEAWGRADYGAKVDPQDRPSTTVVFAGNLKLIHRLSGRNELFDLARDPGETTNLFGTTDPRLVEARERMMEKIAERITRPPGPAEPPSEEQKERLRALGYIR